MIIADVYQHDEPQVAVITDDQIDTHVKQRPPLLAQFRSEGGFCQSRDVSYAWSGPFQRCRLVGETRIPLQGPAPSARLCRQVLPRRKWMTPSASRPSGSRLSVRRLNLNALAQFDSVDQR
jgi:hypothetical protein